MQKSDLIAALRELAGELKPFIQEGRAGSLTWNGTSYIPVIEDKQADTYALVWWSNLNTTADLLEAQDSELNFDQMNYLQSKLLGGMGSFNDYSLDTGRWGEAAKIANRRLGEKRALLIRVFQGKYS